MHLAQGGFTFWLHYLDFAEENNGGNGQANGRGEIHDWRPASLSDYPFFANGGGRLLVDLGFEIIRRRFECEWE